MSDNNLLWSNYKPAGTKSAWPTCTIRWTVWAMAINVLIWGSNRCFRISIWPGQVITARGSAYPVPKGDEAEEGWAENYFEKLRTMLYPGCVVVIESGGEQHAG